MAILTLAYRRIGEAARFFLDPQKPRDCLQIDSGIPWCPLQVVGTRKLQKCRWAMAHLHPPGPPGNLIYWNGSPAPRLQSRQARWRRQGTGGEKSAGNCSLGRLA